MTLAEETRWLDATAQAALVRDGHVTPLELVDAALDRIERLDAPLNAVVIRWFEHARAVAADPGLPPGPFRGVPFLLKDLGVHYAGQPLSNGNRALAHELPPSSYDSEVVARYRRAGLVIAGRTASSEFGSLPVAESEAWGLTRNPWCPERTPGGSSGGAAAAVAAGMVPVAHGSDGGGSIRIPASCCGLFGLKPTQGRITTAPDRAETGVGVDHVLTRTVRDSAALLDTTAGPGIGDTIPAPPPVRPFAAEVGADAGRLRIGLLDHHPAGASLDPEVVTAVHAAGNALEALGHHVEPGYPAALEDLEARALYGAVRAPEMEMAIRAAAETLGRDLAPGDVQPFNEAQAARGRAMTAVDLAAAMNATARYRRQVHRWWHDGWDLLLTPTVAELPLRVGELAPDPDEPMAALVRAGRWVPFTPTFNVSGQPAVNVPLHWADDLPVGVQLVAAYGREDLLLRVSAQLEVAHPWAHRHPSATGSERVGDRPG